MNLRLVIGVMSCFWVPSVAWARTPQTVAENQCGVDARVPGQRVFAKVDKDKPWQEYKSIKAVPELALGFGTLAEVWKGHEKAIFIRTDEPSEDFEASTEYCFGGGGQLIQVAYDLRTAWGWGFRMRGPVRDGALRIESSEFFSTEGNRPIPKPDNADDIRDALKPSLFMNTNQLPFSRLLSQ